MYGVGQATKLVYTSIHQDLKKCVCVCGLIIMSWVIEEGCLVSRTRL